MTTTMQLGIDIETLETELWCLELAADAYRILDGETRTRIVDYEPVCTSDDPTNHQGDTCPIHESEA